VQGQQSLSITKKWPAKENDQEKKHERRRGPRSMKILGDQGEEGNDAGKRESEHSLKEKE